MFGFRVESDNRAVYFENEIKEEKNGPMAIRGHIAGGPWKLVAKKVIVENGTVKKQPGFRVCWLQAPAWSPFVLGKHYGSTPSMEPAHWDEKGDRCFETIKEAKAAGWRVSKK